MEPETLCEHLKSLQIYARHLTRDPASADDLLQEVALQVLSRPHRDQEVEHPKAYLKTMLRHRYIDQHRKASRQPRSIALEEAEIPDPRQNCILELLETRTAIADLPDSARQILALRVAEGLSYEGMAERLNLPLGTVMSRLNRARSQLRQMTGHEML